MRVSDKDGFGRRWYQICYLLHESLCLEGLWFPTQPGLLIFMLALAVGLPGSRHWLVSSELTIAI